MTNVRGRHSRDARIGGKNMNRRDGKHSRTKSRDARNVGNTSSRKSVNSTTAVGTAAAAETLATTGSPEPSTAVITTTGAETPTTATTITTAGTHGNPADTITSATEESVVTAKEAGLLQDTSRDRDTSNSSVSSNFANQERPSNSPLS